MIDIAVNSSKKLFWKGLGKRSQRKFFILFSCIFARLMDQNLCNVWVAIVNETILTQSDYFDGYLEKVYKLSIQLDVCFVHIFFKRTTESLEALSDYK